MVSFLFPGIVAPPCVGLRVGSMPPREALRHCTHGPVWPKASGLSLVKMRGPVWVKTAGPSWLKTMDQYSPKDDTFTTIYLYAGSTEAYINLRLKQYRLTRGILESLPALRQARVPGSAGRRQLVRTHQALVRPHLHARDGSRACSGIQLEEIKSLGMATTHREVT